MDKYPIFYEKVYFTHYIYKCIITLFDFLTIGKNLTSETFTYFIKDIKLTVLEVTSICFPVTCEMVPVNVFFFHVFHKT